MSVLSVKKSFMKNAPLMHRRLLAVLVVFAFGLAGPSNGFPGESSLPARIAELAQTYHNQLRLAESDRTIGVALTKAAETWWTVARAVEEKVGVPAAKQYLAQAQEDYHRRAAKTSDPQTIQLTGLNLLYQSLNTTAFLLARSHDDRAAIQGIQDTEKRILKTMQQADHEGPALAALSGGVLTMLAIMARQLDRDETMTTVLNQELEIRRQVDENIYHTPDLSPPERILLLTNNHLFGAFSMIQIIGLVLNPGLKDGLRSLESGLMKAGEQSDLADQLAAGSKAVAEAGFLVAPEFEKLSVPTIAAPNP